MHLSACVDTENKLSLYMHADQSEFTPFYYDPSGSIKAADTNRDVSDLDETCRLTGVFPSMFMPREIFAQVYVQIK